MDTVKGALGGLLLNASEAGLTTSSLLVTCVILLVLYFWPIWNRHLYPPGPWPLPFIGQAHWFITMVNPFERIYAMKKQYGEVITLDMPFGKKLVILNSAEAIYDGFVRHADQLSARPEENRTLLTDGVGLLNESDGRWQPLRRHALAVFKEHGIGNKGIESVIHEEITHYSKVIEDTAEPFNFEMLLMQAISNIITTVTFGDRFDYSDEKLETVQFSKFVGANVRVRFFPFLKLIPFDPIGYHKEKRNADLGIQFAKDQIAQHKKDVDYDSPPRDYIDAYLLKMKEAENDPDTPFSDSNLLTNATSFYVAGTETTTNALLWAFLYMIVYPKVQEKIYEEIKQQIGERKVSYADRNTMPYTQAVLTELMRVSWVVPASGMHAALEDVEVMGVRIPKGTTVMGNIHASMYDPDLYPEPDVFRPERFIDDQGNFIKPDPKKFFPFSAGRRLCLGEHLARAEYFIFFISTLQSYKLQSGQDVTPSTVPIRRFVMCPQNYLIKTTSRS